MLKDEDTIDTDSIDRACQAAATGETCCFCGETIHPLAPIDRAKDGRAAHYRCSEPAFKAGEWEMWNPPVFGVTEDGDDERAAYYLNGGTDERGFS
jgi:hypothetical protein